MHVVIVGAGIAGLTLAKFIKESGEHTVTILEANEDLGGTWLPRKTYHNLETHGCRAAFVTLPALTRGFDRLAHASAVDVFHALHAFVQENDLGPLITYNSKVTSADCLDGSKVRVNIAAAEPMTCDFFIQTGSTSVPHVPDFKGKGSFAGKILAAADVGTGIFEDIVKHRRNVVVLGGSKAAQDTVFNFAFRGYAQIRWVFRRTYWGTSFHHARVKYELGPTRGMQAYCRYVLFLVRYLQDSKREGLLASLLIWCLYKVGFIVNPHPDWKLGNFHGAIFDKARLRYIEEVPYDRTEVSELRSHSIVLKSGKEVPCDVLICCTGYKNEKAPIIILGGAVLAHQLDSSSFFRGFIHPRAPRVGFMNSLTLGNIASDSSVVGRWLTRCYFPLLQASDDGTVRKLLERSATRQREEMMDTRCRAFNLWDPFDRPIQFMYHNLRRFLREMEDPAKVLQEEESCWRSCRSSLVLPWLYPFAAAAFLLRSTGSPQ